MIVNKLSMIEVRNLVAKANMGCTKSYEELEKIYDPLLKSMAKRFANRNITENYQDVDDWYQITRMGLHEAIKQYKDHIIWVYSRDNKYLYSIVVKNRRTVHFSKFLTMYILKNTNLVIRKLKRRMLNGKRIEVQTLDDFKIEMMDNNISSDVLIKTIANVKKSISFNPIKSKVFEMILNNRGANAICSTCSIKENQYNKIYDNLIVSFKTKLAEVYN